MKTRLIVACLLVLLTNTCMASPLANDLVTSEAEDSPQSQSVLSAEGDESSESITTPSETLGDDVMFYPDVFFNTTNHLIISDSNVTPIELGVYTNTYASDPATWRAYTNSSYGPPYESIMVCIFTVSNGDYSVEGIKLSFEMARAGGADSSYWQIYNFDTESYDTIGNISSSYQWYYHTTYDPDYWDTTTDRAYVRMYTRDDIQHTYSLVDVDVAWLQVYTMHLADSDHYAEGFTDVSDWSAISTATISSDDDVVNCTSSASNDGMIITGLSISADYMEIHYNVTDSFGLDLYNGSWQSNVISLASLSYITAREPIHSYNTITQIRVRAIGASARSFYGDYLRLGPATEMGFCHDGSTTLGVTDGGGGSSSSDGDYLSMVADSDGSAFEIVVDTPATAAHLSSFYYSFLSLSFHSGDSADYIKVESYDGAAWATVIANTTIGTTTRYTNVRAEDVAVEKFRLSVNPSATVRMDWLKSYSIANFSTYSGPATIDIDDYCYVDSGALIFSEGLTYPEYMTWDHDPALSVAVATYNVWNITADDINPTSDTDLLFYATVGGSEALEGTDESRGTWSNTGTLTDLRFIVYNTMTISAIKFWEDSLAPEIGNVWATPYSPTEVDDITLSVYTVDWTDLYKVTLNAIDYPASFNDVNYNCSKNSEDTDLWAYTFTAADMPAGYYAFVVTADDGANTVTDLIIFRVVTVFLQIIDIVLITATEQLAQMSGHINKDASYTIYENDLSVGSGSVAIGWFSFSWTKDDTAGTYVELGIEFTSGVYTEWVNGSYSVASGTTYDNAFIYTYNQGGDYVDWENFIFYVNDTEIPVNTFYNRTNADYNITITDIFGDTIYSEVLNFSRSYRIELDIHSFILVSELFEPVWIKLTSSGGGYKEVWLYREAPYEWWVYESKSYQWYWDIDRAGMGQTQGPHYYPTDGSWYTPTSAMMYLMTGYGMAELKDDMPVNQGGGSGLTEADRRNITQSVIDDIEALLDPLQGGSVGIMIVGGFTLLAYLSYALPRKVSKAIRKPSKPKPEDDDTSKRRSRMRPKKLTTRLKSKVKRNK